MPTVFRSGRYRFYFYSHEPNEAPHVHVDRDDLSAKFWLDPVQLVRNFWLSRPRTAHATINSGRESAKDIGGME